MSIPSIGYTLRYEYGIFKQEVRDGYQVERPDNWLRFGDPWMVRRSDLRQQVQFGDLGHGGREHVIGLPHDYPVAGWGGETVHTIRCWSAVAPRCDRPAGDREWRLRSRGLTTDRSGASHEAALSGRSDAGG